MLKPIVTKEAQHFWDSRILPIISDGPGQQGSQLQWLNIRLCVFKSMFVGVEHVRLRTETHVTQQTQAFEPGNSGSDHCHPEI